MNNFKRHNNRSGQRRMGRSQMHKAVCNECGKDCEVPFKPTGEKPVYCNDCFRGKDSSSERVMHKAVCDKCKKECEVPFKPSGDKSVYCSQCFSSNEAKGSDQINEQLESINSKLDEILKVLSSPKEEKKVVKKKVATKKVIKKKVASKKK